MLAFISRPDICARLARIAFRINALQGCDVYRINDLIKIAKERQQATVLKYVSSSQLGPDNLAPWDAKVRHRRKKIHGNDTAPAGWSDAAYGDQSSLKKRRLRNVIGLMSPNLCGPCHIIHWASKFRRKLVRSSLGGEVYAFSEMLDHMSMLREFYGHFVGLYPGIAGLEDCDCLATHSKRKKMIAEKFPARRVLATHAREREPSWRDTSWRDSSWRDRHASGSPCVQPLLYFRRLPSATMLVPVAVFFAHVIPTRMTTPWMFGGTKRTRRNHRMKRAFPRKARRQPATCRHISSFPHPALTLASPLSR